MNSEYAIEMLNITKKFGPLVANNNITLRLKKGEIHALLGENGAGKSTLMSILFGLYQPDEGQIKVNGEVVNIKGPLDANALGIGMVHQHFKLVHSFTVLENIILGIEKTKNGILDMTEARQKVIDLSQKYKLSIDPDAIISNTTVGMQQRTEILKMLFRDNDIMIFDEPTAVLTPEEIEELMIILKNLKREGKSILFISHKLDEIKEVADRCTILRLGAYIDTVDVASVTKEELSDKMVGRHVELNVQKKDPVIGDVGLSVKNLSVAGEKGHKDKVNNVSFDVHKGEIVCIAGIDGNGQSELIKAIAGTKKLKTGTIIMNGVDVTKKSIRYRSTHGLSHIPEDRHRDGLVLDYNVMNNTILQQYFTNNFSNSGFLNEKNIFDYSEKLIDAFDIRSTNRSFTIARGMSGGNQQKVIVARELSKNPDILLCVQPTRGLDVGAIEYIHKEIVKIRDAGKAVLLVSFELEEVMNLSDRILVMFEGEIVGEFNPKTTTINELGLYMAGSKRMGVA